MITVGISLDAGFFGTLFVFIGGGLVGSLSQALEWTYSSKPKGLVQTVAKKALPESWIEEESPLNWIMKRVTGVEKANVLDRTFGMCGASAGVYGLIGAEFAYLARHIYGTLKRAGRARRGSVEREIQMNRLMRLTSVALGHVLNVGAQVLAVSTSESRVAVGRLFVTLEWTGKSLRDVLAEQEDGRLRDMIRLRKWCGQIVEALCYLAERKIAHKNLSSKNVMVDREGNLKLADYELDHVTDHGRLVSFPIGYPEYLAPEILLRPPHSQTLVNSKVYSRLSQKRIQANIAFLKKKPDVWSLGILLMELYFGSSSIFPFNRTNPDEVIDKSIAMIDHDMKPLLDLLDATTDESFRNFVKECLVVDVTSRHDLFSLKSRHHDFLLIVTGGPTPITVNAPSLHHLFHLWKLLGGDVETELRRQGAVLAAPSIQRLPLLVKVNQDVDAALILSEPRRIFTDLHYPLSMDAVWAVIDRGMVMNGVVRSRQSGPSVKGGGVPPPPPPKGMPPPPVEETGSLIWIFLGVI
ncbi:hypothetical protein HDU67_000970, partial [Dinochytrium kinnereticum]